MPRHSRALLSLALLLASATQLVAQPSAEIQRRSYPLKTCVVSGAAFEKGAPVIERLHAGHLVRLADAASAELFDASPERYVGLVEQAVVAAQLGDYPLEVGLVSAEPLGEDAVDHVWGTRLVRLGRAEAVAEFEKKADGLMIELDAAWIEKHRAAFPVDVCVVTNEPLEEPTNDLLWGTRVVRLCCNGCEKEFRADPDPFLAQLDLLIEKAAAKRKGKSKRAKGGRKR